MINGHKWFSSNGSIADFLIVMAVTDPDARPHQRASMFIVDADTPGVKILRDVATMEHPWDSFGRYGNHAEILYEDVRVPAEALLGAQGAGFLIAQQRLYPGRIHHCMRWLGVARRAFDMLCERSLYRYAHGSTLLEPPDGSELDRRLRRADAGGAADDPARRVEDGHRGRRWPRGKDIAMIKFYGAQVLHDVVDRALQAHGALGYSTDLPLEAMYRFARAARIYDGPDEVHRASVARQVLRGYEAPADGIPTEHIPTRREAARRAVRRAARSGHRERLIARRRSPTLLRDGLRSQRSCCSLRRADTAPASIAPCRRSSARSSCYGAPVYVRKEIVHNKHVVEQLRDRGAVFVESETEVPEGATVVFSAHGVAPSVHANAAASASCTRSTPPARWSPRSTSRRRSSPPRTTRSCSSATPATRRSRARWARRPTTSC